MRRAKARYPLWFAILLLAVSAVVTQQKADRPSPAAIRVSAVPQSSFPADYFVVSRVIDGDTFELNNGEHIRLIGIDTPESRVNKKAGNDSRRSGQDVYEIIALGKKAKEFTRTLLAGKAVRLEYDVTKRDKYGRLLAYVYLSDGTFINNEIIRQGFASPMSIPPNVKYQNLFKASYQTAREEKKGLWSDGVALTAR